MKVKLKSIFFGKRRASLRPVSIVKGGVFKPQAGSEMKSVIALLTIIFCKDSCAQLNSQSLRNRHLILAAEEWRPYFGFITDPSFLTVPNEPYNGIMMDVLRSVCMKSLQITKRLRSVHCWGLIDLYLINKVCLSIKI